MVDRYTPRPEHKFSFGLWTVGNRGRDPFGDVVREALPPVDAVALLAEVGAWGVNFHDNDLVPIDASPADRDRIVRDFRTALEKTGLVVPMATTDLFRDPVFRGGREGVESEASKDPLTALKHFREALDFLCGYVVDRGYDLRFALEPKP